MRLFIILLSTLICAAAHASDSARETLDRAIHAHGDGRAHDAAIHYRNALRAGLPAPFVPIAESGYCVTRAWIRIDRQTLDFCRTVLRHGGPNGRAYPEILANMLSTVARYTLWRGYYEEAKSLVGEFDSWYKDVDSLDLAVERQQIDISRAELARVNGKPAEAMAIVEQIVKDGLLREGNGTRSGNEIDGVDVMKTLLFAAADLRDQTAIRNAVERFDKVAIQLRSAEGVEYGSIVMLCSAHILTRYVGLESRKIYGEVIDRTYVSMNLLVKAHDLNRQRQLLQPYTYLMKECGITAFYATMPGDLINKVRQSGASYDEFRQIFDHYDAERYADTAKAFDKVISAFREHPGTAASMSVDHLTLLRKYLLDPPGRRAPG